MAADLAPLGFDAAVSIDVTVACEARLELSCSISFNILLMLALEKEWLKKGHIADILCI